MSPQPLPSACQPSHPETLTLAHRYTGEDMEELEFAEAHANIADLIVRYMHTCIQTSLRVHV